MTIEEVKDIKLMDLIKYLYVMKKTEEAESCELSFIINIQGKKYNCKCSIALEEYEDDEEEKYNKLKIEVEENETN